MSIRPIDHSVLIPKSQELSNAKQTEIFKNKNIVQSQFIQEEKTIKNNSKKVLNTEKTLYNKIKKEKEKGSNSRKKGEEDDDSKDEEEKENLKIGNNIDIRI